MSAVQPMQIVSVSEPWSEAKLIDGTIIKMKIVFVDVGIVIDDDGKVIVDANGEAKFAIGNQVITAVKLAKTGAKQWAIGMI